MNNSVNQRMKAYINKKGFTLLEITATLVISGFMITIASMVMGNMIDNYIYLKARADAAKKATFAINRIINEFIHINVVSGAIENENETTISFDSNFNNMLVMKLSYHKPTKTIRLCPDNRSINYCNILIDNVNSFNLEYLTDKFAFNQDTNKLWDNANNIDKHFIKAIKLGFSICISESENDSDIDDNNISYNDIIIVPRFLQKH